VPPSTNDDEPVNEASPRMPVTALERGLDARASDDAGLVTPARTRPAAIAARPIDDDIGDDSDDPELARLRPKSRWRWLLAVASLAVAGASVYRTLYVGKSPLTDTAGAVPAAVLPPTPPPSLPQESPPQNPASVQGSVTPQLGAAPPETAASQSGVVATDQPKPEASAAPKSADGNARKAATQTPSKAAGSVSAKKTAKQTTTKQASPGRQKLSAKPRKPPQKKKRSGIIRKSPF
jgi:hypothetical protein